MSGFVKVYSSILASSVWGESLATRVIWITMLAMADRNGYVEASSDGIARSANVPLKQADAALEVLSSPDSRSKTRNDDTQGRRIERTDDGYQILNYLKYRELQTKKQQQTAERQRRFRESHPVTPALRNGDITPRNTNKRPKAEAKAEAKEETTKATTSAQKGSRASDLLSFEQCEALRQKWESIGRSCEYPRFRKALRPLFVPVQRFTPEQLGKAIEAFDELAKADGPSRGSLWHLQRFVDHIGTYVEWGEMPGTDDKGLPTARGKAAMGMKP